MAMRTTMMKKKTIQHVHGHQVSRCALMQLILVWLIKIWVMQVVLVKEAVNVMEIAGN